MMEITPDATLVVAVERSATGASTHQMRGLLYQYELACYAGNELLAHTAERTLRRTLLNQELTASS